ncbi:CAP domain-containing protein [Streptomyces sp. MBT56]|uniref:CAP domain-containing protein n=1 Tax=unclassified Streptomyces TaxID=2593676 RepID=UPI00190CE3D1|nr:MULTISPECIES: CAP domain-containing protein [unclassified Streptomyces]MBK3561360.1 CAP domain-containing protein [Streptomyces sp. MBT56]MBK3604247.1 CAP domain-containing protein [Streptomyces sp. MBT54]MBK3617443.1 CAP domain-containing protein [Streptomyces sp. MBT98]MBK6042210.1 CAP domain-containing protein [Streptomyces sp. MBT55]
MGRHRRSAAGPAAEEPAAGAASRRRGTRRKKSAVPIRTGLLGVSAAVAVGAVAVASGLVPGGDSYTTGNTTAADQVRTGGAPDLLTQGGSSTAPADRSSSPTSRGSERPEAPSTTPTKTPSPSKTSKAPSKSAAPSTSKKPAATPSKKSKAPTTAPEKSSAPASKAPAPPKTSAAPPPSKKPSPSPTDASARSEVLALVNQERAKVGCSPLSTSAPLTSLAQNFSEDMAARGFFDHTDPDGDTPWDRAAQAGVQGLAAENIARGQADAQAVMEGWMNSEGHRANILNCDYKTIGIGIHEGSGGPWWVQNFGF